MSASRRLTRSVSRSTARKTVAVGAAVSLASVALVSPASAGVPSSVARIAAAPFTGSQDENKTPVTLDVSYELDGEKVSAQELVGKSGLLEVTYLVRNQTTTATELTFKDGKGNDVVETVDLVTPYVGRLTVGIPGRTGDVKAEGAEVYSDGLAWSLVLFDPIGEPAQQLRYTSQVTDAQLPTAELEVAKVMPNPESRLGKGVAAADETSANSTRVTDSVFKIDSSVLKLRDGASQLFDGLVQLADGAGKLEDGLAGKAAPGAQKLSDGLGSAREGGDKLSAGLGQLSEGSKTLGAGLNTASDGGKALSNGLDQLVSGGGRLIAGLDSAAAGGTKLATGLDTLEAGLGTAKDGSGKLAAGLTSANTGAGALAAGLPTLAEGLTKIEAGLTKLSVELPAGLAGGLKQVKDGIIAINAGYIDGALLPGIDQKILPGFDQTLAGVGASQQRLGCAAVILGDLLDGATPAPSSAAPCYPAPGRPALTPEADPTRRALLTNVRDGLAAASKDPALTNALTGLKGGVQTLRAGLDNTPSETNPNKQPGLKQALLGQVIPGIDAVNKGVTDALAGALGAPTTDPNSPLAQTLIGGTSLLKAGAGNAAKGSGELSAGLQQLAAGGTSLDGGLAQLLAGSTTASDGATTLSGGLGQLAGGGGQLSTGAGAAAAGAKKLSGGLDQLAAGGGRLVAGLDSADEGGGKLADGLGQLDDGAATLATGLNDAAEGSGKLEDGIVKVRDGVETVRNGAGELSGRGTSALGGSLNAAAQGNARKAAMLQAIAAGAEGSEPQSFNVVLAGASSDEGGLSGAALIGGAAALALLTMVAAGVLVARRRSGVPAGHDVD